jgi:diguanylate cyclase (GGDEF)-like protein/PAS domain S-box-containing protein
MPEKKTRILLIEDNLDEAELIREMLASIRRFEADLVVKERLADGLDYLLKHRGDSQKVDVVLLDLNLPDSKGFDTFDRLYHQVPWVPVVLMTGLDNEEMALNAVRMGAQDYLVKTEVDGNLLVRSVRYAIERKRGEEALRISTERYTLAVEGANDGLWDWDLLTDRIYFSPRWSGMLGYQADEIGDDPNEWLSRIHPDDVESVRFALLAHMNGLSDHFEKEHRMRCKDGGYVWVLTRGLVVRNDQGTAYRMAGSQSDITLRKRTEEQLLFDAFHDSLTGLPNRALFMDRLQRAVDRSKRYADYRFAVLFLDLDRFKVINDSLGHLFGDLLLTKVAEILSSCLRAGDSVARLGGDEFVILLEKIIDLSDAIQISDRIQRSLGTPTELEGQKVISSASIGIVLSDDSYTNADDVLRDADIAMYHAKMRGKACHAIFTPMMRHRAVARLELENDLRQVITNPERLNQELSVVFQPIVSLQDERIVGFEALLRWKHPERGMIPPVEFIPVAEETGLIHILGLWVIRKACEQVRLWHTQMESFPDSAPVSINVNISGIQFTRYDLVDQIKAILDDNLIDPSLLSLEITESFLLSSEGPFQEIMGKIRDLGINLHVDDFGQGYSSFSYLQRFPVTTLKIDQLFTQHLGIEGANSEIVHTIVRLAQSLGMSVVAEGVETNDQLQVLKEMNCPYIQGFFISEPLTGQQASDLLLENWTSQNNKPVV